MIILGRELRERAQELVAINAISPNHVALLQVREGASLIKSSHRLIDKE